MIPLLLLCALALDSIHYTRGLEAAQSKRWDEARQEFLEGRREAPSDKRFLIELAGIDYRTGQFARARAELRAALRIDPSDAYANDFLGTLYFLDSNYEAAIKYWNRTGKPRIESIETVPPPPVRPELLDRALAFAPGEILSQDHYSSTLAWIRGLDAFGDSRLELVARPQEQFDAVLRWTPTNRWTEAAAGLDGIPFQTFRYERHNLGQSAATIGATYRWDAQKRRILAEYSAPLEGDPRMRYRLYTDDRSETWNFEGTNPQAPGDFRLRKVEAGGSLRRTPSGRFSWEMGARVAERWFGGVTPFASGASVVASLAADYRLLNLPEQGLTLDAKGVAEVGRFFSSAGGIYSRAEASLEGHWRPDTRSKYEASFGVRTGRILGAAPFDELFSLGRERDDAMGLPGYIGTRWGKKGLAPTGGQYAVAHFDLFHEVWKPWLGAVDVGPLLDAGRMWHQISGDFAGQILVDGGVAVRLRLPGVSFVLSYARPMRGGVGAWDAAVH